MLDIDFLFCIYFVLYLKIPVAMYVTIRTNNGAKQKDFALLFSAERGDCNGTVKNTKTRDQTSKTETLI